MWSLINLSDLKLPTSNQSSTEQQKISSGDVFRGEPSALRNDQLLKVHRRIGILEWNLEFDVLLFLMSFCHSRF